MALNSREAGASVKDLIKKYNALGDKNNPNNNNPNPKNPNKPRSTKSNLVETKNPKTDTSTNFAHGTLTNDNKTKDVILPGILSAPLVRLIGAYLDDITHAEFANGLFFSAGACDEDVVKRRAVRVKHELLPYIFSGQPDSVEKFLKQEGITPLAILTETGFDEGYFSNALQEFVRFRFWPSVTPLQAAACTGDEFILKDLLAHIVRDEKLKREAILQLEEVQQGISEQKILLEAIDALFKYKLEFIDSIYKNEFSDIDSIKQINRKWLEKIKRSQEFQKQMDAFRCEMENLRVEVMTRKRNKGKNPIKIQNAGTIADQKLNADRNGAIGERKKTEEGTVTKFTGDTEFLSGVIILLKAYANHWIQKTEDVDMDEDDFWWGIVGECHKRLYEYIKQEFNDDKPFSVNHPPSFQMSPGRGPLVHEDRTIPLNLDHLGFGTQFCSGFHKASVGLHLGNGEGAAYAYTGGVAADARAIAHLYKLRVAGLDNIIKQLKKSVPENTIISSDSCSKSSKPS